MPMPQFGVEFIAPSIELFRLGSPSHRRGSSVSSIRSAETAPGKGSNHLPAPLLARDHRSTPPERSCYPLRPLLDTFNRVFLPGSVGGFGGSEYEILWRTLQVVSLDSSQIVR